MKKLICLMIMLCSFFTIYAEEEYIEPDVVNELQEANKKLAEENEQLKKLISESATIPISEKPVETKKLKESTITVNSPKKTVDTKESYIYEVLLILFWVVVIIVIFTK